MAFYTRQGIVSAAILNLLETRSKLGNTRMSNYGDSLAHQHFPGSVDTCSSDREGFPFLFETKQSFVVCYYQNRHSTPARTFLKHR